MNAETANILCTITNDFYRDQSASFSESRQAPWPGWKQCLEIIQRDRAHNNALPGQGVPEAQCSLCSKGEASHFSVFDLACGNLRFEAFLVSEFPDTEIAFYAVDNCDSLVFEMPSVDYQSLDIGDVLQQGLCLNDHIEVPLCDLSVSFGFMHHIPMQKYREKVLAGLVRQTFSGGYVVVSFWQFLNNKDMAEKARVTHEQALEELNLPSLDENDFLLGWKNIPGAYRYCHSFSDTEIDQLITSVSGKATLMARFQSDGRSNNLNTYVVMKVC